MRSLGGLVLATAALACVAACDDETETDAGMASDGGGDVDAGPGGPVDVTVDIDTGTVIGAREGDIVRFWGIPYAEAPAGDLRWQPPEPRAAWAEPLDLRDRDASIQCPQLNGDGEAVGDDDCLQVNVFTPGVAPESPLPVMVWIHGGAWRNGSARQLVYEGSDLAAAGPVVVVNVNYRLDQLGYFAHPALTAEGGGTSGNYGLLDMIEALGWVQRNIGRFGGDAANVTIFGESAGGHSVCELLVSPTAAGLFHRAVSQSGTCSFPLRTLAEAETDGSTYAAGLGCDGADALACLRALPTANVLAGLDSLALPGGLFHQEETFQTTPITDGVHLPMPIDDAMRAGAQDTSVPVILGTNTDEAELFHSEVLSVPVADEAEYRAALARLWDDTIADAIVTEYPVAEYDDADHALMIATTHGLFGCPARITARSLTSAGNPTYQYVFGAAPDLAAVPGAYHGAEILFVFNTESNGFGRVPSRGRALSEAMQGYWTRFAATGDPNGSGAVPWPRFDPGGGQHLYLDFEISEGTGYLAEHCDFWDTIYDGV